MDIRSSLDSIRQMIDEEIKNIPTADKIPLFYEPIHYINDLSGKKIRPLFTVLSGLAVDGKIENLINPAAAVELLHNFSLVHDDIMDDDNTRRGKETVHAKWDIATAILTGDGLLGLAYRKLLTTPNLKNTDTALLFTNAMLEICEGQALDKTFEESDWVAEEEYLAMICKKTATLIQLSCHLGAIAGEGLSNEIKALSDFGYEVGMGFQIQDDLLDIMADERKLGKRVGSDLAMNKKTIVTIRLAEKLGKPVGKIESVDEFRKLIKKYDIIDEIETIANVYFNNAKDILKKLPQNEYTAFLVEMTDDIRYREK